MGTGGQGCWSIASTAVSIAILFSIATVATGIAKFTGYMFSIACDIAILIGLKYCNTWKQYVIYTLWYTVHRSFNFIIG